MGARKKLQGLWRLISEAGAKWFEDNAFQHGAALAFYTIFAISPMFLILTSMAGLWFGDDAAQREVFTELARLIGPESAEALRAVIADSNRPNAGLLATAVAIATLAIGTTTVFVQLQTSLNFIWKVQPKPANVVASFLKNRLLSFAMILAIGFLLLVSLLLSAALAALSKYFSGAVPGFDALWQAAGMAVSFALTVILFAMIFKYLPDIRIQWREVAVGALMTSALFTIGKYLIGQYLGRSAVASTYGAAGSLVVVLLWVYYSSLILFYGAEITRAYVRRTGRKVEPAARAEWA